MGSSLSLLRVKTSEQMCNNSWMTGPISFAILVTPWVLQEFKWKTSLENTINWGMQNGHLKGTLANITSSVPNQILCMGLFPKVLLSQCPSIIKYMTIQPRKDTSIFLKGQLHMPVSLKQHQRCIAESSDKFRMGTSTCDHLTITEKFKSILKRKRVCEGHKTSDSITILIVVDIWRPT